MILAALAVLAFVAAPSAAYAGNVTLPDLRTGNVNGRTALLFWPGALPPKSNPEPQPFPIADGCDVHLVSLTDLDTELLRPCGKWFILPSRGKYNYWLETGGQMTPTMGLVVFANSPFRGSGLGAIVPLAPAGRIAIPAEQTLPDGEGLRAFSTRSVHSWNEQSWVFTRRISAGGVHAPFQMPEGEVVVGRFDRKTNDAVALSRPIPIKPGTTAVVWPQPPAESDVLVILDKPGQVQLEKSVSAALTLSDGSITRSTDVLVNGRNQIIAIWYGVSARHATIAFQSNKAAWPSREIELRRGKVTAIRSRVQPQPKVSVFINAPPDAKLPEELSLDVGRPAEKEPLRHLAAHLGALDLASLPAEPLRITLNIGRWKMIEDVDLSSGEDAKVTFDIQPISVSGTVYFGDDPAPAEVSFLSGEEWPAVRTNERGDYETTFWWPDVHVARIKILGTRLPPYTEAFVNVLESGKVDFHVPKTDYLVRVHAASTGQGIPGARVTAGSIWTDANSKPRQDAQYTMTDDSGVAVLPPIQKGELFVTVHADHYAEQEPLRMQVDDQHHELDVALQPLHTVATLHLRLASGAPAAQAEAWAFDPAMQPIWRGAADANGILEVPDAAANALLLIRHLQAASTIRPVRATEEPITWTLEPPASPLTIETEENGGAIIVLWLDGVRLSGPPLSFATWSLPAANPTGTWTGRNLPPRPIRILAIPRSAYGSNAYDAVAQRIDYPWPPRVTAPKL